MTSTLKVSSPRIVQHLIRFATSIEHAMAAGHISLIQVFQQRMPAASYMIHIDIT